MRPHHTAPALPGRDAPPPGLFPAHLVGPCEVTLAAALDAPAAARAAMAACMAGHVGETTLVDAQLVVANSVRHADTPPDAASRVRGEIGGDAARLEVKHRGSAGSIARHAPDLQRGGGFGLNVVEARSRRWGVDRHPGTRVWAEIGIRAVGCDPADRGPAVPIRSNGNSRRDAASAADLRAENARRRAVAARRAEETASTEFARRADDRVADLHAAVARHHEDSARTHRLDESDPDGA